MKKKFNYRKDTKKGIYKPLNPAKYIGSKYPSYKSSWEEKMMVFMDMNPHVVKWGYECIPVPYINPTTGKKATYLPDIIAYIDSGNNGKPTGYMIEIKPYSKCIQPKPPKKPKSGSKKTYYNYQQSYARFRMASMEYAENQLKWGAARVHCQRYNMHWILANEKNIPGFLN
jgi:hypothetical protein